MDISMKANLIAKRLTEAELYTRRFGSFSKSDYETLMFSIYLDMLNKPARNYDISIDLGITESKVRSLRVNSQLLYPRDLSWQDELQKALHNAVYNENDKTITLMIEDPSIQNLLKNEIELAYGPVHLSLNPKLLTLSIEGYLLLALHIADDEEAAIKELNKRWSAETETTEKITKESIIRSAWSKTNKLSLLKSLLSCAGIVVPAARPILSLVSSLIPDS